MYNITLFYANIYNAKVSNKDFCIFRTSVLPQLKQLDHLIQCQIYYYWEGGQYLSKFRSDRQFISPILTFLFFFFSFVSKITEKHLQGCKREQKCWMCHLSLESMRIKDRFFCSRCSTIQPLSPEESNYFSLFGLYV